MKILKKYILIIAIIPILFSCDDYLDVIPAGAIIPKTVDDYEDILNSPVVYDKIWPPCDFPVGSDELRAIGTIRKLDQRNLYTWQSPTYGPSEEPLIWSSFYKAIYSHNVILNSINDVTGDPLKIKEIEGEALLGRGFEHLMLLNLFSKPYNASTANSDPGIPYVTVADINEDTPSRLTIEKTYELIIKDLKKAIALLPETQEVNYRGTKSAAYGVLARLYLYKGDYNLALENANKAMAGNEFRFLNYVAYYTAPSERRSAEDQAFKDESIYFKSLNNRLDDFKLTHQFIDSFEDFPGGPGFSFGSPDGPWMGFKDLRLAIIGGFGFLFDGYDADIRLRSRIYYGVTYPEMLLTKAEALVRDNHLAEALNALNLLRRNRIRNYVDATSANQDEILTWVLDERRKETFQNGLRWFDMRRLAVEGRLGTITRETNIPGVGLTTFTLVPNGNNYTYQIPAVVIQKNPEMEQNVQ